MSSSNEADLLEIDSYDLDDVKDRQTSDEDTEDASETEAEKKQQQQQEFTGIKEQMYHDKLAQFRRQLQQLKDGSLPLYMKKVKKLTQNFQERLQYNKVLVAKELNVIDEQYVQEKTAAAKEFEEKKIELNSSLIQELESKKQIIESERSIMELTGDTMVVKPVTTRKLRRRPNDPVPVPEKRGKPSPVQLTDTLDDEDIMGDLALVQQLTGKTVTKPLLPSASHSGSYAPLGGEQVREVSIEEGRLFLDKRWFSKDQMIMLESKDLGKVNASIFAIGADEVVVKKVADGTKLRVSVGGLQSGQYNISVRKRMG